MLVKSVQSICFEVHNLALIPSFFTLWVQSTNLKALGPQRTKNSHAYIDSKFFDYQWVHVA